jgi:hypothetical protein
VAATAPQRVRENVADPRARRPLAGFSLGGARASAVSAAVRTLRRPRNPKSSARFTARKKAAGIGRYSRGGILSEMPLSLAASGNADHAKVLPARVCVAIRSVRTWLMGTTKLGARPMAITGRVRLRKTMTGRVLVQIEDTRNPCPWSSRQRVCWRDAKVMDLSGPRTPPAY